MARIKQSFSNKIFILLNHLLQDPVVYKSEDHRIAAEALGLVPRQASLLVSLFHDLFYRQRIEGGLALNRLDSFLHFVNQGVNTNLAPGPFFDPTYCAERLAASGLLIEGESILLNWLRLGVRERIVPTTFFDPEFYLVTNSDVAKASVDPFLHFLDCGLSEGRAPNEPLFQLKSRVLALSKKFGFSYLDLLSAFPQGHEYFLADQLNLNMLRAAFQKEFYLAQVQVELDDEDLVAHSDKGKLAMLSAVFQKECYLAQVQEELDDDDVLAHFLVVGLANGYRPTILFNEEYYRQQLGSRLAELATTEVEGAVDASDAEVKLRPISVGDYPFMHWFCIGRPNRIVPTPLFDEEYYLSANKDLHKWTGWLFNHYVLHGVREQRRRASVVFSSPYYLSQRPHQIFKYPLLDFVLAGDAEGTWPAPDITLDPFGDTGDLKTMTRLEHCAIVLKDKIDRLNNPTLRMLIDHAAYIDPMVLRPYGQREFQWPPLKHGSLGLMRVLTDVRRSVPQFHYDTIVLIPHCRMAGSARVAGALVRSLRTLYPFESLLLVLTELSEFQRPDWFGEDVQIFDLAAHVAELSQDTGVAALLDLVRGLTPKRVINVNSRFGWELAQAYGRQIATWTNLYAYLFTWDLDKYGNKGGYPINWFYPSFDAYSGVFVDNAFLVEEIADRYALSRKLREKIHLLHTPADLEDISYERVFEERRRPNKRLRCFWAGRFDRQKRFDIVIEIARRMPNMEFFVWGKQVLGGIDVDFNDLPINIKLQGIYENFDDLPLEACDFFLYTSEWDGLPTILLDVGVRGIATVASRVGGTADLINETTAWPVDDALNPDAYVAAIEAMCADPAEVTRRAGALRVHTKKECNEKRYHDGLKAALEGSNNG